MKTITKKEWEKAPRDCKKVYDGTRYMLYKETDGGTSFGPVKVLEDETMDSESLIKHEKGLWACFCPIVLMV